MDNGSNPSGSGFPGSRMYTRGHGGPQHKHGQEFTVRFHPASVCRWRCFGAPVTADGVSLWEGKNKETSGKPRQVLEVASAVPEADTRLVHSGTAQILVRELTPAGPEPGTVPRLTHTGKGGRGFESHGKRSPPERKKRKTAVLGENHTCVCRCRTLWCTGSLREVEGGRFSAPDPTRRNSPFPPPPSRLCR